MDYNGLRDSKFSSIDDKPRFNRNMYSAQSSSQNQRSLVNKTPTENSVIDLKKSRANGPMPNALANELRKYMLEHH